jgi:hypothetical protein
VRRSIFLGGGCKFFSKHRRRLESAEVSFSAAQPAHVEFFNRRRRRFRRKTALNGKLSIFVSEKISY